jgi:hypothetical protein
MRVHTGGSLGAGMMGCGVSRRKNQMSLSSKGLDFIKGYEKLRL